ncbi:MAG: hypothetical protein AMXMBFR7_21980 [Planctomycetota bacterium]
MPLFTRRTPSSRLQRLMEKAPLVVAFFGLGAFGQAQAATYNVDTTTDGLPPANLSLREAIIAANAGGATDTINVPAGTYLLSYGGALENLGFGGDLDITHANGTLTIVGAGQGVTVISAFGYNDRIMHKIGNGTLILRNLTLYGGIARDNGTDATSALGGGLLAEGGSVILDNVEITQCQAFGADGADATSSGAGGEDGADAQGGGIYTAGSSLQFINGSVLAYCNAIAGDGGNGMAAPSTVGGFGGEGGNAAGGGIFASSGTVTITESNVNGNFVFGGGGGDGRTGGDESTGSGQPGGAGGNGGSALGGGLFVDNGAGTVLIDGSDFTSNRVYGGSGGLGGRGGEASGVSGTGGNGGGGGAGGDVQGGGLWINNGSGTVSIFSTAIQFGQGAAGFAGAGGNGGNSNNNGNDDGGDGGSGGRGGEAKAAGLYLGEGLGNRVVTLTDLLVYGNSLTGGGGGTGGIGGDATNGTSADGGDGGSGGEGNNADGGGIWAGSGTVTITGSELTSNSARGGRGGTGGAGGTGSNNAGDGGGGNDAGFGRGGGLWASSSNTLTINTTTIQSNGAFGERGGPGGRGGSGTGGASTGFGGSGGNGGRGGSAQGGGIFQVGNGVLSIDNCTISFNSANASYGGQGGAGGTGTSSSSGSNISGGNGGNGGNNQGGGLYFGGDGALTLSDTTVSGNSLGSNGDGGTGGAGGTTTSTSNSGFGGNGGDAGANEGGGIWINTSGAVTIERSTISNNLALTGANGGNAGSGDSSSSSPFGGDGGSVRGAGIYLGGGVNPVIRNSTISGNLAYAGGFPGGGATSGSYGGSDGGGLWAYGTLDLLNSTFANNNALAYGGGIFHTGGGLDASSILVGDNFAGIIGYDAFAYFASIAYSLIENGYGHNATDGANGNIVGQDAYLGALADNGGPTFTHAIDATSPAYNTGANTGGLGTDQRGTGFSRVGDGQADIGAFEFQVTTPAGNLDVRSLRISNVFRYPNKDQIIFVVRFDNPGAVPPPRTPYPFAGIAVTFDIGGAAFNFTLDARGRSGTQCKAKYLKRTNQIELRLNTGKGDFHDNFADEGLTDQRIVGQIFNVPVAFQFDATAGSGLVPVKYTCFSPSAGNGVGKGVLPPP